MAEMIGLQFRYLQQLHYTLPYGFEVEEGQWVIARTRRGKEIAKVVRVVPKAEIEEHIEIEPFVRKILRPAQEEDHKREEQNRIREAQAIRIGDKKVEHLGLPMRMIRVHYLFDNSRILFYFKAPHKVDFRELVRDLASVFKTRIELRQIGVRDEAKILGGVGVCGRDLCCTTWMREFFPVTVRMAKDQHISLNPTNISGICGRLKCCLVYEQAFYEASMRGLPPIGSIVMTGQGQGKLLKADIFHEVASILTDDSKVVEVPLGEIRGQGGRISARSARRKEDRRASFEGRGGSRSYERRKTERRGGDKGRRSRGFLDRSGSAFRLSDYRKDQKRKDHQEGETPKKDNSPPSGENGKGNPDS
jgi:cell fate regulator YaaT (PSP1 superfamily)